eukprot:1575734-Pleurochrysis_carterae.AAC.1
MDPQSTPQQQGPSDRSIPGRHTSPSGTAIFVEGIGHCGPTTRQPLQSSQCAQFGQLGAKGILVELLTPQLRQRRGTRPLLVVDAVAPSRLVEKESWRDLRDLVWEGRMQRRRRRK